MSTARRRSVSVKIIRTGEAQPRQGSTFTGNVDLRPLLTAQQPGGAQLSVVHFEDGARTHWHTHPGEQVLYVLDGVGRVGTETEESIINPGDVVYAVSGERHWHGAAPGASMTHLSFTTVGSPEWFEAPED
jgi:quercetin dioxygenase-like cupin family protein